MLSLRLKLQVGARFTWLLAAVVYKYQWISNGMGLVREITSLDIDTEFASYAINYIVIVDGL